MIEIPNIQAMMLERLYAIDEKVDSLHSYYQERLKEVSSTSNPYKTVKATAEFLDCSEEHVYKLKGRVPYHYVGARLYFKTEDLIKYMESGRVSPKSKFKKA
ncbi:helix-turn-helix domain-containing protein [Dyadobacter sp. CY351]|uniref:helix-turn-helix domain-containing protein n=1 Tax=Dyadobacter sp. CY351 TaxID=2909337 RepID=UPI001F2E9A0C|nr:helix-turn-helix domain-containing protein [Dyadobacter sp. CY351]MCF2517148.1 helix-turn-helix domain-containing protein [Dyadobacter sp. CY351]